MRIVIGRRFFVALGIAMISGLIFRVSFFQDNSEAYLFPSIIAALMLALSLLSLAREALDLCIDDFQAFPLSRQLPAILMMVVAVSHTQHPTRTVMRYSPSWRSAETTV